MPVSLVKIVSQGRQPRRRPRRPPRAGCGRRGCRRRRAPCRRACRRASGRAAARCRSCQVAYSVDGLLQVRRGPASARQPGQQGVAASGRRRRRGRGPPGCADRCAPRAASSCTTVLPVGYQSRYGKSVPTMTQHVARRPSRARPRGCRSARTGRPRTGCRASSRLLRLERHAPSARRARRRARAPARGPRAHRTRRGASPCRRPRGPRRRASTWSVGAARRRRRRREPRRCGRPSAASRPPTSPGTVSTATPPRL